MIIDLMPNRNFLRFVFLCVVGVVFFVAFFLCLSIFIYKNILGRIALILLLLMFIWVVLAIRKSFIGKPSHLNIEEKILFTVEKGFFIFQYEECSFNSIDSLTLNVEDCGRSGLFYRVLIELDHKEIELGSYKIKNNALLIVEKLSQYYNLAVHYTETNYLFRTMEKPLLNPQYRFSAMPSAYFINGLLWLLWLCIMWMNKLYFMGGIS